MRKGSPTDFIVDVEGVGSFTFARRKMADEMKIQVEYARYIDGVEPTDWLAVLSGWLSVLKILTVKAPDGWDIEEMDPMDPGTYANLRAVYNALTERRALFEASEEKTAKSRAKKIWSSYEFWFRQHYKLTENDPRYLNMTREDIMTDYWAVQYLNDPKQMDEVEDEDFDMEDILRRMEDNPDDWQDVT